ncbi:helix-turn-helix domain-containing protein [Amycolatopsis sp. NPDC059021]|uniref:helix-turn-helix domain-containing protein n=1 Tax=Amycolatopsis sp. NPDC059021 TaxID=3346704 RepID=UPI003671631F
MEKRKGLSKRQRRVSAELRALRIERGVTCLEVADALGCSESKISRMETGVRGLYPDEVSAILGFLRAPADKRKELLDLLRRGEERNWHEVSGAMSPMWAELIRFEQDAVAIRNYEPLMIPGLAQTSDYTRALMWRLNPGLSEADVEKRVSLRRSRQRILGRHGAPDVRLIVEETTLRRTVGDTSIIRAQLEHLLALNRRSTVTVRVVPFSVGAHPGHEGPVMLLDYLAEPTFAYAETRALNSFLEDGSPVDRIKSAWRQICSAALSVEDSARLIASVLGDLTTAEERA